MKNWWLIYKGTNTQSRTPELDIGCVTVLWGLWAVMGRGGSVTVCSSSYSLAFASPLGVNLKLNEWVRAVVAISRLYPRYSTSPVVFLQIHQSTEAVAGWRLDWFESGHRAPKNWGSKTVFFLLFFLKLKCCWDHNLSPPFFCSQRST